MEREKAVVVDANKLIAAFLKNGLIRRIIVLSGIKLYTIEQVLEEVNEHKDELLVKAGIDERVYNLILEDILLPHIAVVEGRWVMDVADEAREISRGFDPDDWPVIALALKLGVPIWTNDKKIMEASRSTRKFGAITTHELLEMLVEL
ncbi:MAG TPA: hypothetical protein ENF78_06000 [Candidatus Bathyarchaeota archaeon]|nr:hypothetical protein [Candidatus Bathyarchaeota archaeon]